MEPRAKSNSHPIADPSLSVTANLEAFVFECSMHMLYYLFCTFEVISVEHFHVDFQLFLSVSG